ncbi:MAG: hypothetical protein II662_00145, partial [Bacteroidales bacterium]|nr:hypothetical protein [Bacteroidales bacterium]
LGKHSIRNDNGGLVSDLSFRFLTHSHHLVSVLSIGEIIEENRDTSDIEQNLNEVFNIISDNINESNHEKKMSFICLFFEILISENIDFSIYLQKTFSIINQSGIYSDEYIKRIINICSNATIEKKALYNNLIDFSKNKIEYLYIIFSLAGFKDIIVDNISDSWELIIDLLDNPEIKSNSNSIKSVLKCLELLINLSETKFRPYASSALYQALDYLTETDTELQKRSLMIIYSLTKYCDEQLQPLSTKRKKFSLTSRHCAKDRPRPISVSNSFATTTAILRTR